MNLDAERKKDESIFGAPVKKNEPADVLARLSKRDFSALCSRADPRTKQALAIVDVSRPEKPKCDSFFNDMPNYKSFKAIGYSGLRCPPQWCHPEALPHVGPRCVDFASNLGVSGVHGRFLQPKRSSNLLPRVPGK